MNEATAAGWAAETIVVSVTCLCEFVWVLRKVYHLVTQNEQFKKMVFEE